MNKYYNNHSLYIFTNNATKSQIDNNFKILIAKILKEYPQLNNKFYVNYITTKDGANAIYAYVYIVSTEVFHIILGNNSDGTERFDEIDDKNWIKPEYKEFENINGKWADEEDDDKYVCPKIKIKLEPKYIIDEFINENGESKKIDIYRSFVTNLDDKINSYTLFSKNIPNYITDTDIKNIFKNYVFDTFKIKSKGKNKKEESYPAVNITKNRMVFVTFSNRTRDGQFMLQLCKVSKINKKINNEDKECLLIFNHSINYNTD